MPHTPWIHPCVQPNTTSDVTFKLEGNQYYSQSQFSTMKKRPINSLIYSKKLTSFFFNFNCGDKKYIYETNIHEKFHVKLKHISLCGPYLRPFNLVDEPLWILWQKIFFPYSIVSHREKWPHDFPVRLQFGHWELLGMFLSSLLLHTTLLTVWLNEIFKYV